MEENDAVELHSIDSTARNRNFVADFVADRIGKNEENDEIFDNLSRHKQEALIKHAMNSLRHILGAVTFCLLLVTFVIVFIGYFDVDEGVYLSYLPFKESGPISTAAKIGQALVNSLIMISLIVFVTALLIVLIYFRCFKIIYGWMCLSTAGALFITGYAVLIKIFVAMNWNVDIITVVVLLWNFAFSGVFTIYWKAPGAIQRIYLILFSVLMGLIFIKYLPEWTTWVLLAVVAIYDIFAVLAPFGILKILINVLQSRNQQFMPGLIYFTMAWFAVDGIVSVGDKGSVSESAIGRTNSTNSDQAVESQVAGTHESTLSELNVISNLESEGAGIDTTRIDNTKIDFANGDGDSRIDNEENNVDKNDSNFEIKSDANADIDKHNNNTLEYNFFDEYDTRNASIEVSVPAQMMEVSGEEENEENENVEDEGTINNEEEEEDEEIEVSGVKLGLGDFIFYSVLVGKAASRHDWITTLCCIVAILAGLCTTLIILSLTKKPLPALPFSIALGLIFYFGSCYSLSPMMEHFSAHAIFL